MAQNPIRYQQSFLDSRKIRETARNTAVTLRAIDERDDYMLKKLSKYSESKANNGRIDEWEKTTSFVLTGAGELMVVIHEVEFRRLPPKANYWKHHENTDKHLMTDDEICMLDRRVVLREDKSGLLSEYFAELIAGTKDDGLLQCLNEAVARTRTQAQQKEQWILAGLSSCHGTRIKGILNRRCSVCGFAQLRR